MKEVAMKKSFRLLVLIVFSLLIISIFSILVVAKDDDENSDSSSSSSSSNSASNQESNEDSDNGDDESNQEDETEEEDDKEDEEKVETKTIIDEQGRKVTVETKTETEDGETKTEEKRTFVDESGNKIVIETETEIGENGEIETEVKRKIITPDGREIVFKTETEVKDGKIETKTSIEIQGIGFETKLEVKEETEEGKTKLKAKLSTGAEQEIITQPDEVLKTALAEIGGKNIRIELTEITEDGTKEAVFKAKTTNPGRFIGIFNVNVDLEALIDTQTGQIVKTNRPWWAFLVIGYDKATICHVSEDEPNKRNTLIIAVPAVKAHLAHGDSVGECPFLCGDNIIVNPEHCDDGNLVDGDGCSSQCQIETPQPQAPVSLTITGPNT